MTSVGFQYVLLEFFSHLMSHVCCMATTFPTDGLFSSDGPGGDFLAF